MIEIPRLAGPSTAHRGGDACDGFIARMRSLLQQADADGLLPWAPHAMAACKDGTAVGVKVAGDLSQLQALNPLVDGDAMGLTRFVVAVFPEALSWWLARDAATPREFVGSRADLVYALGPLISAGLAKGLPDGGNYVADFGHQIRLPGVRTVRVLPMCSSLLFGGGKHG